MISRTPRPLAIAVSLLGLVLLRLLPTIDPINRLLIRGHTEPSPPSEAAENDQLAQALAENAKLRAELALTDNQSYAHAAVVNKTLASFRTAVRLGAGSEQGLSTNQVVLSEGYVIGLITAVEPDRATALLLGDPDLRIPVVIGEAEGIVYLSSGSVIIDQVVGSVAAEAPVLTSGVEGIYSPGLLVGRVGASLPGEVFGRYVLERPFQLAGLSFVSVRLK